MSERNHPEPPGGERGVPEDLAAGLARQIHTLTRRVDDLDPLPGRVDDLTQLVGRLTETVAAITARRGPAPAPSWLMAPGDTGEVRELLDQLCAWLAAIFLRYPDGASCLPECWPWHPDVVEELLWLMHAWCAAYQGAGASVGAAGDWHDRQRPGVVNRIRRSAGSCSREAHQTRPGWSRTPSAGPEVPGTDGLDAITGWWASRRHEAAPEPETRADGGGSS